jgi:hypothetical protein
LLQYGEITVLLVIHETFTMSEEQLRDQTHERWRETLELLGITPTEVPGKPPNQPAPEPTIQNSISEIEPAERFETQTYIREEPEPISAPEAVNEVELLETRPQDDFGLEGERAEASSEFEEEPRSRGRRRGRRGGRSRSQGAQDGSAASNRDDTANDKHHDAELSQETDELLSGEKFSPGRREDLIEESSEPEPEDFAEGEDEEVEPEVTAENTATEPEEEPDTLSDWNVPSWQELIASLYRPDR